MNILDYLTSTATEPPDPNEATVEDYESALQELGVSLDE